MRGRLLNLKLVSSEVVDEVCKNFYSSKTRRKMVLTYRCVVSNALASVEYGVVYSRNKLTTNVCEQYNPYLLDNQSIIRVVESLTEQGYLTNYIAPRDTRPWVRKKERSWYKATQKLLDLFTEADIIIANEQFSATHEGVIMRNKDKQEIPYTDTPRIEEMRKIVNALNTMNEESLFTHNGKAICGSGFVRIFTEDFEQGGRWYRCSVQNIRQRDSDGNKLPLKQTRLGVEIDGSPVVEVDYSCLHPVLLCALYNIPVEKFYGDIYSWMLPENALSVDRKLLKVAMNIMFNAMSDKKATLAIAKEMLAPEYKGNSVFEGNAQSVVDHIKWSLPEFEQFFCQDNCTGLFLQNIDSQITEEIVKVFIEQQQPILLVHDSFIVEEHNCNFLQDTMEYAFRAVTRNTDWEIPVATSYVDGTVEKVLLGKYVGADADSLPRYDSFIRE